MKVSKNFDKDDCIHYERVKANGCCGRKIIVGVCVIPNDQGNVVNKTCSMKKSYCRYQPKEEDNVHFKKLSDSDSGIRDSN